MLYTSVSFLKDSIEFAVNLVFYTTCYGFDIVKILSTVLICIHSSEISLLFQSNTLTERYFKILSFNILAFLPTVSLSESSSTFVEDPSEWRLEHKSISFESNC